MLSAGANGHGIKYANPTLQYIEARWTWHLAGVVESRDFRFESVDLRFKGSQPGGQECLQLNLQSAILNHK